MTKQTFYRILLVTPLIGLICIMVADIFSRYKVSDYFEQDPADYTDWRYILPVIFGNTAVIILLIHLFELL